MAGRSNVGKSSLTNAVTASPGLARTSKTPGRTRQINFFEVGDRFALVDLPGFGYARVPESEARAIGAMMREYLAERENLAALVMLVDCRRGPQQEELALAESMRARGLRLIVAATKCDQLKRSQRAAARERFAPLGAPVIFCSALSGEGIDELRSLILRIAAQHKERRYDSASWSGGEWPKA